jgi:hypothetical protein
MITTELPSTKLLGPRLARCSLLPHQLPTDALKENMQKSLRTTPECKLCSRFVNKL